MGRHKKNKIINNQIKRKRGRPPKIKVINEIPVTIDVPENIDTINNELIIKEESKTNIVVDEEIKPVIEDSIINKQKKKSNKKLSVVLSIIIIILISLFFVMLFFKPASNIVTVNVDNSYLGVTLR